MYARGLACERQLPRSAQRAWLLAAAACVFARVDGGAPGSAENEWVMGDAVPAHDVHTLRIALVWPHSAAEQLRRRAAAGANGVEGRFMTLEEVREVVAVPDAKVQAVCGWFVSAVESSCVPFGLAPPPPPVRTQTQSAENATDSTSASTLPSACELGPTADYLYLSAPVGCIGAIFRAPMHVYHRRQRARRAAVWRLRDAVTQRSGLGHAWNAVAPASLRDAVLFVTGLDDLPPVSTRRGGGSDVAFPGDKITPPVIWSLYGVPASHNVSLNTANGTAISQSVGEVSDGLSLRA